jgi:hypothetical protein
MNGMGHPASWQLRSGQTPDGPTTPEGPDQVRLRAGLGAWSLCLVLFFSGCATPPTPRESPTQAQTSSTQEEAGAQDAAEKTEAETGTPKTPGYLPASESGAEVEMSEMPVGAPPDTAQDAGTERRDAGGAGRGDEAGAPAGLGGAVPPTGARAGASAGGVSRPPNPVQGAAPSPAALPPGGAALATPAPQEAPADPALEAARKAAFEAAMERRRGESTPTSPGGMGGAGEATGLGSSPDITGETRTGGPARPVGNSGLPTGAADEDVVARQIREAAEREADPVLREKLWREYRRYTEGG